MLGEDAEADALRLDREFCALCSRLADADVGALTLILDRLAIDRDNHDFEKVLFKLIGCFPTQIGADVYVRLHPIRLPELDDSVHSYKVHALNHVESECRGVKDIVIAVSEMRDEFGGVVVVDLVAHSDFDLLLGKHFCFYVYSFGG